MSAAVHPMACPVCRSVEVTGDEWEMDGEASQAWQQVSCDDCGSRWFDVYAYSHQEISHTGSRLAVAVLRNRDVVRGAADHLDMAYEDSNGCGVES